MKTRTLTILFLAGTAIAVGCGGSQSPTAPQAQVNIPAGSIAGVVSANHAAPHVAVITAAQLSAGAGITLELSGGFHSHTATLTGTQIGQIAARVRVSVVSSTDPHSNGSDPHNHTVTFN